MSNSPQNQDSLEEKLKVVIDSNNYDKNYNVAKALVSSVPAIGSLVVPFVENYIVPPATQRLHIFLGSLVRELEQIKSKIESVNFETPVFQTTFMQACQIAARTHKEQKLEALKNAVLNSSIPRSLEDDVLAMFLNWIDGFTALHISTLKHLHYLDRYAQEELHTYFPLLEQNRAIYNQVLKDLADRSLISLTENYITEEDDDDIYLQSLGFAMQMTSLSYQNSLSGYNRPKKRGEKEIRMKTFKHREDIDVILENNRSYSQESKTTELGKQFIEFIENPSIQTESM
ncbi:hypothetical protein [Microcoleus sp. BROC3]|uniref:hypothetical protein n=1 Tax=Microcoleus sp. BROC3 TaxID=3055323 RepID=UPI002FD592DB